jgi:DNA topoisomerase-1
MDYKVYLKDPGIYKKGNHFYYNKGSKQVTDDLSLERLKKIYTPPAWKNVWFASKPKCHIQAHGIDAGGKKQYILSDSWINNSRYEKYNRMKRFIKDIKNFKKKIKLTQFECSRDFLTRLLFNLLIDTHIRVGNEIYAETNGSYGLTTLRQRHLVKNGNNFNFNFVGKGNIEHNISLPEKYNIYLDKLKKNNGNGPLFIYSLNGKNRVINSEELNEYLKVYMGSDYTCKDFRTYSANILFINSFLKKKKENLTSFKLKKKFILDCIDSTAEHLGHTRNISRKSYISNNLLDYCQDYFEAASRSTTDELISQVS